MARDGSPPEEAAPPEEALLDVKGGLGWSAARVPVELELARGSLRIAIAQGEHTGKERKALQRLLGSETAAGSSHPLGIEVDLESAEIAYPRVPGRRSWIVIKMPERPTFRLYFLDWKDLEDNPTSLVRMGKHSVDARSAAAVREAWRNRIEAESQD